MSFLKQLALWLSHTALGLSLFLTATSITLLATVLNPAFIKSTLDDSGFYKNIVPSGLKLASIESSEPNSNFNQNVITELTPTINRVLSPAVIKSTTETVINGATPWLNGEINQPKFVIDVAAVKASLNKQLADYFSQRLANLPACPINNDVPSYNIVTTNCRPPIDLVEADFLNAASDLSAQIPTLKNNQINSEELIGSSSENQFWTIVPTIYGLARLGPYILGVLILIAIAAIIVLSSNRVRALKIIGHTFIVTGAALLITGAITVLYLGREGISFIGGATNEQLTFVKEIFVPISHIVATSIGNLSMYFGAGYGLLGAACYFAAHRLKIKQLRRPAAPETSSLEEPETHKNEISPSNQSPFVNQGPNS